MATGLSPITDTGGTSILLPLFPMLVFFLRYQAGVCHTLWTTLSRIDNQILILLAHYRVALSSITFRGSIVTDTL